MKSLGETISDMLYSSYPLTQALDGSQLVGTSLILGRVFFDLVEEINSATDFIAHRIEHNLLSSTQHE
jgi:hypothetical protein